MFSLSEVACIDMEERIYVLSLERKMGPLPRHELSNEYCPRAWWVLGTILAGNSTEHRLKSLESEGRQANKERVGGHSGVVE